jgi:4,5-dihydroxyphthalate decarboxylase
MHVVVIRREIYERNPWVARSLYKAFSEAKEKCYQALRISNTLAYTLPWLFADIEELREIFGSDWWPYGIEANRHVLETLIRYMGEQGLLAKEIKVEEVFAPSLVGEFKI